MSKLSHLLELIIILQYKEFTTAAELSDILQVDKKTVYRYIDTLQMAKIPVESKKGRYGGFYIDEDFYMKYPNLDNEELQALLIASNILTKDNGFVYAEKFKSAIIKIKDLSINKNKDFEELKQFNSFKLKDIGNLETFDDKISKINYAMTKGKVLKIKYYSLNKNCITEMSINPYTILFKEGIWYLIGYCNTNEEERIFRISRIKTIEITKDIFIKPKNFNLREYLKSCWDVFTGEKILVKIKFDKDIAKFIEENKWNSHQSIESLQDGSIILNIYINDLGEVKKWILGFGELAEVLEPKSLREEISSEISKLIKKYKKIL
ncbi:helix-turn-helix transcriptional regulator [Clostridium sp. ZS2-4]|uniref:helix-turn-helix transcriptional regulator n=1 Tax=Clostridium sp. ZS2-4 TaxID=2987703 RepID=UPI00227BE5C5|nr:transcriptional regulator [Clostridium sp. ZS2-4]MCY6355428.1 transcriptional regulator [Clostridium sp. ZS2-4]